MVTATDFRSVTLPSIRERETLALASSPIPINLFTITALRTRFMNPACTADIPAPGSGDDGGNVTGEASDGRPLASPEFGSSLGPSWN